MTRAFRAYVLGGGSGDQMDREVPKQALNLAGHTAQHTPVAGDGTMSVSLDRV
jgi:hypothetical protein